MQAEREGERRIGSQGCSALGAEEEAGAEAEEGAAEAEASTVGGKVRHNSIVLDAEFRLVSSNHILISLSPYLFSPSPSLFSTHPF